MWFGWFRLPRILFPEWFQVGVDHRGRFLSDVESTSSQKAAISLTTSRPEQAQGLQCSHAGWVSPQLL